MNCMLLHDITQLTSSSTNACWNYLNCLVLRIIWTNSSFLFLSSIFFIQSIFCHLRICGVPRHNRSKKTRQEDRASYVATYILHNISIRNETTEKLKDKSNNLKPVIYRTPTATPVHRYVYSSKVYSQFFFFFHLVFFFLVLCCWFDVHCYLLFFFPGIL